MRIALGLLGLSIGAVAFGQDPLEDAPTVLDPSRTPAPPTYRDPLVLPSLPSIDALEGRIRLIRQGVASSRDPGEAPAEDSPSADAGTAPDDVTTETDSTSPEAP